LIGEGVLTSAARHCGNKKMMDDAEGRLGITDGRQRAKQFRRVARQKRVRSIGTWVSDSMSETAPALLSVYVCRSPATSSIALSRMCAKNLAPPLPARLPAPLATSGFALYY